MTANMWMGVALLGGLLTCAAFASGAISVAFGRAMERAEQEEADLGNVLGAESTGLFLGRRGQRTKEERARRKLAVFLGLVMLVSVIGYVWMSYAFPGNEYARVVEEEAERMQLISKSEPEPCMRALVKREAPAGFCPLVTRDEIMWNDTTPVIPMPFLRLSRPVPPPFKSKADPIVVARSDAWSHVSGMARPVSRAYDYLADKLAYALGAYSGVASSVSGLLY